MGLANTTYIHDNMGTLLQYHNERLSGQSQHGPHSPLPTLKNVAQLVFSHGWQASL